jgi:hypothetical protein
MQDIASDVPVTNGEARNTSSPTRGINLTFSSLAPLKLAAYNLSLLDTISIGLEDHVKFKER